MTASGRIRLHIGLELKITKASEFRRSKPLTCGSEEWGGWDSNPGPADYESAALTG